jgi:hypothetical protein
MARLECVTHHPPCCYVGENSKHELEGIFIYPITFIIIVEIKLNYNLIKYRFISKLGYSQCQKL